MVVVVGLKRPNARMTGVSAGHRLVERCWSAPTRAGASHGLTDHLPRGVGCSIGFDLNKWVRTAILAITVAP